MSGAVTKTNKHNTNKEDIPNSSHLPFIGTADTAAGFDIALVIAKASSTKATDQQVERLGHESSLDENVT